MEGQQEKRGPGRPRINQRRLRIDITVSSDAIAFMDWLIGEKGNLSGFIDAQIKAHPQYKGWKQSK